MNDDDEKRQILARRARFIAAAVAAAGLACDSTNSRPEVCLSQVQPSFDASQPPEPPPQVCLSPLPQVVEDASTAEEPPPQPCLSVAVPDPAPDASATPDAAAHPRVCLTPARNPRPPG